MTLMKLELKLSTRSLTEAEGKGAVGVKVWVNNEQVFSLIKCFLITSI